MDTRTTLILGILVALGLGLVLFLSSGPSGDSRSAPKTQELILAETIVQAIHYGATAPDSCPPLAQISLPDQILYDANGHRRSDDEINNTFGDIFCFLDAASPTGIADGVSTDVVQKLLSLYAGVDVRFSNGVVVPGTKPSVRAGLFYFTMIGVTFSDSLILGDNQCQVLRDWIFQGKTMEQRVLALAIYMVMEGTCIQQSPTGSTAQMLEMTRQGNVDAAVQLVKYWNIDYLAGVPREVDARSESDLNEKIDAMAAIIEESRDQHPLVAAAATLEAVNLIGLKIYPHMLFR